MTITEFKKQLPEGVSIHPILFSTPMVQAILEDTKKQTRRTKALEFINESYTTFIYNGIDSEGYHLMKNEYNVTNAIKCPYGKIGDILWVRETFQNWALGFLFKSTYMAELPSGIKWKPSIHMPFEACRLFLKVKSVRVERLNDISDDDAKAEGVEETKLGFKNYEKSYPVSEFIGGGTEPLRSFQSLWRSINGSESWEANPWVWVIEFERVNKQDILK